MKKHRVQLDLIPEQLRVLEELTEISGSSRAAVVRDALNFLAEYCDRLREGYSCYFQRGKDKVKMVVPSYDVLLRRKNK